ncbi:zinc transporter family protein [Psychrobacillus vulpis]|uniref:Zinc transporter family protein n=1 Tax=Psychrobacillus vulpis TaxID=2325572 RepID=A0A544TQM8_9BACI|nr:zinc transporter family protein [Psychrobacillus vulpis]TQR19750.1 zinc transporter family protein [Psychrobacillus vulpis]
MNAITLGILLFLSVSTGGVLAWFISKLFFNSEVALSLLCGGFLVGLLANDIFPNALKIYGSFGVTLGILIGYLFFLVLKDSFHSSTPLKTSIFLLMLAMFLHTIPLSITIGNLLEDSTFGGTVTASTILHHLPEGFALTSAVLSQGEKLWRLFVCFIGLSVFFSIFIWIGHHLNLTIKSQSVLVGVSIGLIASTSIKEFILHNIRAVPLKLFLLYILSGYVLSNLFHFFL